MFYSFHQRANTYVVVKPLSRLLSRRELAAYSTRGPRVAIGIEGQHQTPQSVTVAVLSQPQSSVGNTATTCLSYPAHEDHQLVHYAEQANGSTASLCRPKIQHNNDVDSFEHLVEPDKQAAAYPTDPKAPADTENAALRRFLNRHSSLNPFRVSSVFYKLAGRCEKWPRQRRHEYARTVVLPLIYQYHQDFDEVAVCSAAYLLAKLGYREEQALELLLAEAEDRYISFKPVTSALLLWSLSKLQHNPPYHWMSAFLFNQATLLDRCTAQDLSTCIYSLATLGVRPPQPWLQSMSTAASDKVSLFDPQSAAMFVWGYATLGLHPGSQILQQIWQHSKPFLPAYGQKALAVLSYSMAELRELPDEEWRDLFFEASLPKLASSTPQNLCLMVTAALRWHHHPPPDWVSTVQQVSKDQLKALTSQDLAVLISGLAEWGPPIAHDWLQSFEARTIQIARTLRAQSYSSILVGFAASDYTPSADFMHLVSNALPPLIHRCNPKQVSYIVLSLHRLKIKPAPKLQSAIHTHTLTWSHEYHHIGLRNILCAYADWHEGSAAWVATMAQAIQHRLSWHSAEDLTCVIQSICALKHTPNTAWIAAYLNACLFAASEFSIAQLIIILECLVSLKAGISASWLDRFLRACQRQVSSSGIRDVVALAAGLAAARYVPSARWQRGLYTMFAEQWNEVDVAVVSQMMLVLSSWMSVDTSNITAGSLQRYWPELAGHDAGELSRLSALIDASSIAKLKPSAAGFVHHNL